MTKRSTCSIALLIMFGLISVGFAADAKLDVTVTKETGEPIQGAVVRALPFVSAGKMVEQATKKNGVAELKKLEGSYRIVVRAQGFEPAVHEFAIFRTKEPQTLTIKLKPGDMAKPFYFEDAQVAQQADQLFREGLQALQANQAAVAEEKLKASLAINPTMNPGTRHNLALAYMTQLKWDVAKQELEAAIQKTQALKEAEDPAKAASFDQMVAGLKQLIDAMPLFKLQMEAENALRDGRYEEAATKMEQVIEQAPVKDPGLYYNLALAQGRMKKYDAAMQSIDKALAAKPDEKSFQELKAILQQNQKQSEVNAFRDSVKAGLDAYNAGKFPEALTSFERAQQRMPADPASKAELHGLMAKTYQKLGRDQDVVASYQKAIEAAPEKPDQRKALADYYFTKEMVAEGIQTMTELGKTGSKPLDETFYSMGAAYVKANKKKLALPLFEETLKANPQHAEAHYELGMIHFYENDHKDPARAKQMLSKYVELGKDPGRVDNAKAVLIVIEKTTPAAKPAPKKK